MDSSRQVTSKALSGQFYLLIKGSDKQKSEHIWQCCGSESGAFLPLDPGSGMGKISGSGINIPDPERFETIFFG
jgi:hypothetical protein